VILERQVMDRHDARARPAQRQEAVGGVDERSALPAQRARQRHLLEPDLRADVAPLEDAGLQIGRQVADELLGVATPTAERLDEGIASIDGDDGHGANSVWPRYRCGRRGTDSREG